MEIEEAMRLARTQMARSGGKATSKKYGVEHFKKIGEKGRATRKAKKDIHTL